MMLQKEYPRKTQICTMGMMEASLGLLSAYFCCYIENYEGFLWASICAVASLTVLSVFIKYIQLTLKIFLN